MTRLPAPPERIERWLARRLPDDEVGRSILGDLRQEFHSRLRDGRPVRLWSTLSALSLVVRYRLARPATTPGGRSC